MTSFPDGIDVPWKALSFKESIEYNALLESDQYPSATIEDEIFKKCCLEPALINNIDLLEAGVVSTVVANILEISGPIGDPVQSVLQMQQDLNVARNLTSSLVFQAVGKICQAFPAYKPEEVLDLDYPTFMQRLALAESMLLQVGVLAAPLEIHLPKLEEQVAEQQQAVEREREKRRKLIDQKLGILNPPKPKPQKQSNQTVITAREMLESEGRATDGHEKADIALMRAKWKQEVMQGLENIYPEYIEKIKKGEKITPDTILDNRGRTPEEVMAHHDKYMKEIESGKRKIIQPSQKEKPKKKPIKRRR